MGFFVIILFLVLFLAPYILALTAVLLGIKFLSKKPSPSKYKIISSCALIVILLTPISIPIARDLYRNHLCSENSFEHIHVDLSKWKDRNKNNIHLITWSSEKNDYTALKNGLHDISPINSRFMQDYVRTDLALGVQQSRYKIIDRTDNTVMAEALYYQTGSTGERGGNLFEFKLKPSKSCRSPLFWSYRRMIEELASPKEQRNR